MRPTAAELSGVLDRVEGRRVVVLGDAMVDHYIWGEATRISPEAPVPVVTAGSKSSRPGGSANAAANVVAMSGQAELLAIVGEDADASDLGDLLEVAGVRRRLIVAGDRPTTAKTRVMAGSSQVARIDAEGTAALPDDTERALLAAIESALPDSEALLISDYAKGTISEKVARKAIEIARELGLPVVVDPKGPSFEKYRGATVVTPNEAEARHAANLAAGVSLEAVAERLKAALPGSDLLVTRGGRGMALFPAGGGRLDVPAISHRVHDVAGAGDTVAAVLVVAIAAGAEIPQGMRLANAAAAEAVQQVGVARVGRDDLRRSISDASDDPAAAARPGN